MFKPLVANNLNETQGRVKRGVTLICCECFE